jgi:hypothetical protein
MSKIYAIFFLSLVGIFAACKGKDSSESKAATPEPPKKEAADGSKNYRLADTAALNGDFTAIFVGHIGQQYAIEMSLSRQGKEYKGSYAYLPAKQPIELKGQASSSLGASIGEYGKDGKMNAKFTLALESNAQTATGTWLKTGKAESESLPVTLYRQEAPPAAETTLLNAGSVKNIDELIKGALALKDSTQLLNYLISNNLILNSEEHYTYMPPMFGEPQPTGLRADTALSITADYQNLFGTPEKEAIVKVKYNSMLYFLTFFYKDGENWKQVPSILHFNRGDAGNSPCLSESEAEKDYLSWNYQALRIADEVCLVGQVNGGRCADGTERGNDIVFNVWQVSPNGVFNLFSDTKNSYWYASPSPKPTSEPISRTFEFGQENVFPKKLRVTQTRFRKSDADDFPAEAGKVSVEVKLKFAE